MSAHEGHGVTTMAMIQNSITEMMPSEMREAYASLSDDVIHLHRKWKVIRELYVSGETVIELLNRTAPGFFRICKDVLVDDLFLGIRRLTDPKQTGKKQNLTLEYLADSIDATKYPELRSKVERLLLECGGKCDFAREHSNKRIAHNDLPTKLQVESLSEPTTTHVKDALQSVRALMNEIEKHFLQPAYCNDVNIAFVDYSGVVTVDAFKLLSCLRELEASKHV